MKEAGGMNRSRSTGAGVEETEGGAVVGAGLGVPPVRAESDEVPRSTATASAPPKSPRITSASKPVRSQGGTRAPVLGADMITLLFTAGRTPKRRVPMPQFQA